jgi:hypothetical protein
MKKTTVIAEKVEKDINKLEITAVISFLQTHLDENQANFDKVYIETTLDGLLILGEKEETQAEYDNRIKGLKDIEKRRLLSVKKQIQDLARENDLQVTIKEN